MSRSRSRKPSKRPGRTPRSEPGGRTQSSSAGGGNFGAGILNASSLETIQDDLNPRGSSDWQIDRYFDVLDRWLALEAESERERMLLRRAAARRDRAERTGETLLRMELREHETGLGGRFLLTFTKPGDQPLPMTRLKVGSPVVVSIDDEGGDSGISGVVSRRKSSSIQVATDAWPHGDDWFRIDLSPDETTRRRQQQAMARMRTATGRTRQLRNMILGVSKIETPDDDAVAKTAAMPGVARRGTNDLNPPQIDALRFAVAAGDIAVLHGPPGTGKTTTLAQTIAAMVDSGMSVLACAPSNTAVDNLLEKLIPLVRNVVRVGHPARVFERLREHTLDHLVENDAAAPVIVDMRRELEATMRAAAKDGRGRDARRRRGELYAEAGRLRGQIRMMEKSIIRGVMGRADVVCTTTTIDDELLGDRRFDAVVIDEACQCTLPGIWQAVDRGERLIMAGDHLQLPPTVLNDIARREGLDESPMQRLVHREGDRLFRRLIVQYRMNRDIMAFPSRHFYDDELIADASVRSHTLADLPIADDRANTSDQVIETSRDDGQAFPPDDQVVEFYDTAGAGHVEKIESEGLSKYNPGEGQVVLDMVRRFMNRGIDPSDIAVIAPYGAQVRWLRNRVSERAIEIDTVDGFQGREKEVVILTMTRSNDIGEIGFLSEVRRTNVALTRAKRKLVVIGDSATLGRHDFYADMLDHFEATGAYRTVWELGSN